MSHSNKYPIGTRIRLTTTVDNGKIGTIVGYEDGMPVVYLPTATKHIMRNYYPTLRNGTRYSWKLGSPKHMEILVQKNRQLLFSFMNDG